MNRKTGMVGVERGISYQSLAEQLYIEPRPGVKGCSFSRAQLRRAVAGLEQAGLISIQSTDLRLILNCLLALRDYSVQNKAVINPSQQAVLFQNAKSLENKGLREDELAKAVIANQAKAGTPLKDNNYIYLLAAFEKFWSLYPLKNSKQKAWEAFQELNPNESQLNTIIAALQAQLKNRDAQELTGAWLPPWKYPANWLTQRCWTDELIPVTTKECNDAKPKTNVRKKSAIDIFWESCGNASFDFDEEDIQHASLQ
ncbi:hypothetical protein [Legionella quinlivanii]|nr:hypothetical protein [Legionella quinlivanii]